MTEGDRPQKSGATFLNCPEEQQLVDHFGGKGEGSARAGIDAHLDVCADCRETLSALAQAPDIELDSLSLRSYEGTQGKIAFSASAKARILVKSAE